MKKDHRCGFKFKLFYVVIIVLSALISGGIILSPAYAGTDG